MGDLASKQKYTFYTANEYWHDLIRRVNAAGAGDRIALMTMDFDPRAPVIEKLVQSLKAAVRRGVHVTLAADAATFLRDPATEKLGPLWFRNDFAKIGELFKLKYETVKELAETPNISYVLTNRPTRPFSNPVSGRSHIKFSIINDYVFLGGCNLAQPKYDLMVGFSDPAVSEYLQQQQTSIVTTGNVYSSFRGEDQRRPVDDTTTLFVDAGQKNRSIILDQALQLIDDAEEFITLTCQFFPNSITARHLTAAYRRGVEVTIIYSGPGSHAGIGGLGQRVSIVRERLRVPKELFQLRMPREGYMLHAKLLATDVGTIIGSHNLVRAGVILGTAEIALLSRSPQFCRDALAALSRELVDVSF